MREGMVRVHCALPPEETWLVRETLDIDRQIAEQERRTVEQIGKDQKLKDDAGNEITQRTIMVRVPDDFVPAPFRPWVKYDQLHTRVTSRWRSDAYDEASACVVDLALPALADRVEMGYVQWLEPRNDAKAGCDICTRTRIAVLADNVPGWVQSAIEAVVETSMHSALKKYPVHIQAYRASLHSQPPLELEGSSRPRRVRVPNDENDANESRLFCRFELCGVLSIVCRRPRSRSND
jgi:hypothetical protein